MSKQEYYNRWFSEPVKKPNGFKIHIEVFVEKQEDAVMLIQKHSQDIKQKYEEQNNYDFN